MVLHAAYSPYGDPDGPYGPYNCVAILIKKHFRPFCEFVIYEDPRMMALEVKHFNDNLYFINVYLLYQCLINYHHARPPPPPTTLPTPYPQKQNFEQSCSIFSLLYS